jgi:mannose-1-phosphate guanylyltransferase
MLVETCNRLRPVAGDEEMILVLGRNHLEETKRLFRGRRVHILAEPVGRNTAPCIGLGAVYAQYLKGKEPVAFLPADHYIGDESTFLSCLKDAVKVAESGPIVTLGIVPTRPETGYGYIQRSSPYGPAEGYEAYEVRAFVEKPDLKTAEGYLKSGDFLWNAGIFVATPETIFEELKRYLPDLWKGLKQLKGSLGTDAFEKEIDRVYSEIDAVSFDYGIMEKTEAPVVVVPCSCGWSDVGSWESLYELKRERWDESGNLSQGNVLMVDCEKLFVSENSRRLIACLGIHDCLIVDTKDALLIGDLNRSQEIRRIVERLKGIGKEKLL